MGRGNKGEVESLCYTSLPYLPTNQLFAEIHEINKYHRDSLSNYRDGSHFWSGRQYIITVDPICPKELSILSPSVARNLSRLVGWTRFN